MRVYNPDDASENRVAVTRNLLRRIISALEITDLIALMMVFVAGLSAYTTWKTSRVTNEILLTSQRPYIGIESVKFADEASSTIVADVRQCRLDLAPTFGRPVHRRGGPHRLRPGTSPHALRIPPRDGHPALQSYYERWLQVRLGCIRLSPSCPFRSNQKYLKFPHRPPDCG
jgi:hypothetical protein